MADDTVNISEDFKGDCFKCGLAGASANRILFSHIDACSRGLATLEFIDDKGRKIARGVFLAFKDPHEVFWGERVMPGGARAGVAGGDVAGWTATEIIERRGKKLGSICFACEINDHDGVRIGEPWLVESIWTCGSCLANLPLGKRGGPAVG